MGRGTACCAHLQVSLYFAKLGKNRKETAIPRHVEVENLLAMEICKQLGIEPIQ